MPTNTYLPIATITLTSSDSSITFSNIPQNYRDLVLVGNYIPSGSYTQPSFRLNGDSGNNYYFVLMSGKSWSPEVYSANGTASAGLIHFTGDTSASIGNFILQVFDYSATDKHKPALCRTNPQGPAETSTNMAATKWANTSAVTSLTVFAGPTYTQPFASGSTFSLYGIAG